MRVNTKVLVDPRAALRGGYRKQGGWQSTEFFRGRGVSFAPTGAFGPGVILVPDAGPLIIRAKMVARLKRRTNPTTHPLARKRNHGGHGIGTALSERVKQLADTYSFLFAQLGMAAKRQQYVSGYSPEWSSRPPELILNSESQVSEGA